MLRALFIILSRYPSLSFLRLAYYYSFRTLVASATSFAIFYFLGYPFIKWMVLRFGARDVSSSARSEDFYQSKFKSGTPTMGGVLLIFSVLVSLLLWGDLTSPFLYAAILSLLYFGGVGFLDDYMKLKGRSSEKGLSETAKYLFQFVYAVFFELYLCSSRSPLLSASMKVGVLITDFRTKLLLPFVKTPFLDLGAFYFLFAVLFLVFVTNSVNLTDGRDGLVVVPAAVCAGVYGVFAYLMGNAIYSRYLFIPYIKGSGELLIVAGSLVGACLGFLWFNAYPADLFLGDTGSLAIGGTLATMALMLKCEILFLFAGGIFVIEGVSVFIQHYVGVKFLRRRIFFRAPIHDSFVFRGVPEPKVVVRFWIVSVLLAVLSFLTLKIR